MHIHRALALWRDLEGLLARRIRAMNADFRGASPRRRYEALGRFHRRLARPELRKDPVTLQVGDSGHRAAKRPHQLQSNSPVTPPGHACKGPALPVL